MYRLILKANHYELRQRFTGIPIFIKHIKASLTELFLHQLPIYLIIQTCYLHSGIPLIRMGSGVYVGAVLELGGRILCVIL